MLSLGCVVCVLAAVAPGGGPAGLLARVAAANQAAVRAIRTLQCTYQVVPANGSDPGPAGQVAYLLPDPCHYRRDGDTYRAREVWEYEIDHQLVRKGRRFDWRERRRDKLDVYGMGTGPADSYAASGGWLWYRLLFSHWGGADDWLPFADLIRRPHTPHAAERLPDGAVRVDLSHTGGRVEFFLDPRTNHLVRKTATVAWSDPTVRREWEVVEWAEPAPGVFIPVVVEGRHHKHGRPDGSARVLLSDLRVNQPVSAADLRMPGVAGQECRDSDRKVVWTVDADLERVGPERPLEEDKPSPRVRPVPRPLAPVERPAWWRVGLLAVGAVGALLAAARRRRADAN